jgi:cephalosporin hydroxylase
MGKAHEERLIRGFYPLQKDLRWTKPAFALALDPPRTERPIYLELQFFLAGELMDQARSVTLIASVNGVEVGRQTYYGTGHCVFTRYVPRRALAQRAEVEVEMDRAATHPEDGRLIGLLAASAGLKEYESTAEYRENQIWLAREGYRNAERQRRLHISPEKELELRKLYTALPLWDSVRFQNVPLKKNPLDLWMTQQIVFEVRPDLIVDTDAGNGGFPLYLAQALDGMSLTRSKVIAVDPRNALAPEAAAHFLARKYLEFPRGEATDPALFAEIAGRAKGRTTLVIIDAETSAERVRERLKLYAPLVSSGSYLIVQGTYRDAVPLQPGPAPGPYRAVRQFLDEDGGQQSFETDTSREELIFTFNPGGWLRRK